MREVMSMSETRLDPRQQAEIFAEFWKSGPWKKLGKQKAWAVWKRTVRTTDDLNRITEARDRYVRYLDRNSDWLKPRHGSTWFYSWDDWEDFEDEEPERCLRADHPTAVCQTDGCRFS